MDIEYILDVMESGQNVDHSDVKDLIGLLKATAQERDQYKELFETAEFHKKEYEFQRSLAMKTISSQNSEIESLRAQLKSAQQSPAAPNASMVNLLRKVWKHGFDAENYDDIDFCNEITIAQSDDSKQSPAVVVPEFNGWYCEHCQCGVDPSEVTYHETHTACGRYITDDVPPPSPRVSEQDARAIIDDFYIDYLNHCPPIKHPGLASAAWLNKQGRELLDKLNGGKSE